MKAIRMMLAAVLAVTSLQGCAAIFDGTTQEISVNTNPAGATCDFIRKGAKIANVALTPGSARIPKTKDDITIKCTKDGYQETTYLNHSGVAGATVADVLGGVITGGVAWAVDSGTGADNKYDSPVNLTMVPGNVPAPAPASQRSTLAPSTN